MADPRVRQTVDHALQDGLLWRDPFGPDRRNFAPGKKIDDLVEHLHLFDWDACGCRRPSNLHVK